MPMLRLEQSVYAHLPVRRESAARVLQRRVLTRLTRCWFLSITRPSQVLAIMVWPTAVCLGVNLSVLRDEAPGSIILGTHVRPTSVWQHLLVAAVARGDPCPFRKRQILRLIVHQTLSKRPSVIIAILFYLSI